MANKILKLTTILSLLIFLSLHNSHFVISSTEDHEGVDHSEEQEAEDNEYYVLNTPLPHLGPKSRFLARVIKKGTQCDQRKTDKNVCNGVRANKGRDLLFCCKKHCRNVLSDRNNCGVCGNKCKQGERCCGGVCTEVLSNVHHCGKCKKECSAGDLCGNGFCGYA